MKSVINAWEDTLQLAPLCQLPARAFRLDAPPRLTYLVHLEGEINRKRPEHQCTCK